MASYSSGAKSAESLGQKITIRAKRPSRGQYELGVVQLLQPMPKHGAVLFFEHVTTNVNTGIGIYSQHVRIVRAVMDFAESDPVGHNRLTAWVAVGKDVGGVQQLDMAQAADSAALVVGPQD